MGLVFVRVTKQELFFESHKYLKHLDVCLAEDAERYY